MLININNNATKQPSYFCINTDKGLIINNFLFMKGFNNNKEVSIQITDHSSIT